MFDAVDLDAEEAWPRPRPSDERPLVWPSVHGAYHALRTRIQQGLPDLRLEASEACVLVYLLTNPGASPAELRRVLGFHRSTLASLLTRLERRGYIRRDALPFDHRRLVTELTPRGRGLAALASDVLSDIEEELEGWVSPHDRRGADVVFAACKAMVRPEGLVAD